MLNAMRMFGCNATRFTVIELRTALSPWQRKQSSYSYVIELVMEPERVTPATPRMGPEACGATAFNFFAACESWQSEHRTWRVPLIKLWPGLEIFEVCIKGWTLSFLNCASMFWRAMVPPWHAKQVWYSTAVRSNC